MVTKLAYFVLIFSLLGTAAGIGTPFLLRKQMHLQMDRLGIDDATVEKIAQHKLQDMKTGLYIGLAYSLVGIAAGFGLLQRKAWAPSTWLGLCIVILGDSLIGAYRFTGGATLALVCFRAIILLISLRILRSQKARAEFTT